MKKLSLPLFLIVLLSFVGCSSDKYVFEDLGAPVKSFYTYSTGDLLIKQSITFTNASENADTYLWDFGDGTTSTDKNPTKIFTEAGAFTVKLKAVGAGGTGNYIKSLVVIDPDAIIPTDKFMYFIEYNNPIRAIRKVSLNLGSIPQSVVGISGKMGVGLAVDSLNGKIYYTDFYDDSTPDGKIWRMNMDGSNLENIVSGIADPYSIAVDIKLGKIYWADDAGNISKANLDGAQLERQFVHVPNGQMRGISVNSKTNKIYFYEVNEENLYVVNSDGTGRQVIVDGAYGYSVFVDEVNDKLYYEDRNEPAIMQTNLDGTGKVKIADVPGTHVYAIGIDYITKKLYWSDMSNGMIKRSNLDGTKQENFISQINSPRGFFIR